MLYSIIVNAETLQSYCNASS